MLDLSILNADLDKIEEFINIFDPKDTVLHMDIMDSIFVPQHSFDSSIVRRCHSFNKDFILDTHLMVEDVESFVNEFKDTGSTYITFHYETGRINERIDLIHSLGIKAGVSIKPKTKVEEIVPYLNKVDQVLVMSVEPGLGGQKFIDSAIDKLKFLKEYKTKNNLDYIINVDGGINKDTIKLVKDYCDFLVIGSAITKAQNPKEAYKEYIELLK